MPQALQYEIPRWIDPQDGEGPRYVWPGRIRIVHNQRARKLRKRGVPLLPLHRVHDRGLLDGAGKGMHLRGGFEPDPGPIGGKNSARYAWFEPMATVESRMRTKALHCYVVATRPEPFGRKEWLAAQLRGQRAQVANEFRWKRLAKAWHRTEQNIAKFWTATSVGQKLARLHVAGMTDAELRAYHTQGYAIRTSKPTSGRQSPPLTLFVPRVTTFADDGPFVGLQRRYEKFDE